MRAFFRARVCPDKFFSKMSPFDVDMHVTDWCNSLHRLTNQMEQQMNTFAPLETRAIREAREYGDMWAEQEVRDRQEAESDEKLNVALAAIRKCDLTAAQVRQLLMTLACEMKSRGFCDADVELVDTASEVVG